ncbi:WXG100 family type VII secretion target [Nocardia araoensis]|uniref:WXG100 family type VII secretion target n=1 Tax=Nocardia araoensis TaxID=228600 RepID=UPI0002DABC08|nr:WXG100 family type VII secretion target [Nocardia araoensis]
MGEIFSVDPDQLREHAPRFDAIGAAVAATVQKLRTTLAGEGRPWGNDDAGRAFAESYVPEHQRTMGDLQTLVEVVQQAGTDLRHLAENFENQDRAVGQRIHGVADALQHDANPTPVRDNTALTQRVAPSATDVPTIAQPTFGNPVRAAAEPTVVPRQPAYATAPSTDRSPRSSAPPARTPGTPEDGSAADRQPSRTEKNPGTPDQAGPEQPGSPGTSVSPARRADAALTRPTQDSRRSSPWTNAAAATKRATAAQAAAGKHAGTAAGSTPWSTAGGGRPPRISAPDTGTPGSPPRTPGRLTPRPDQKDGKTNRKVDGSAESIAARLARELAERHGVRAFGFDTPGVPVELLTEIVAAVDDVLPGYPQIPLRAIGIDHLAGGEATVLEWEPASTPGASGESSPTARIVLSLQAATDPKQLSEAVGAADHAGLLAPGCAQRPVYSSIVRELGRALDRAGGLRARTTAQRALLMAYLQQLTPEDKGPLNGTVSGFREWRSRLSGRSFDRGRFHPAAALAEAFTDVVLNGALAAPPAQVLHRLLVTTAKGSPPL